LKRKEIAVATDSRFVGTQSRSLEEIKRVWGDIEVVDAEKDLRVFVQPEDVKQATKKDPGCCVFAQACKRQFAATKVMFWRSVAYVELPGPSGKRRVERFILSSEMRDLIEDFDKGNEVATLAGFELKAPVGSRTFEGNAARHRRTRALKRKALIKGVRKGNKRGRQGEGRYSKPSIVVDLEVRNGAGRVHFKNEPAAV
jgi:hypothetical protein